jgi:glycosyltransferase involved in cell wall biosynthesis
MPSGDWEFGRVTDTATLRLISRARIRLSPSSHVVVCVVRNESLRLPYLLSYYRGLGIDRFFIVDNGSTDGTIEFLQQQPDVSLFYTEDHFGAPPGAGLTWKNTILDQFCDGRWILLVDADELLIWPGSEHETVQQLTRKFDACGAEVLFTIMLDMYSDKPFGTINYRPGLPFLDFAPFFDRGPYFLLPAGPFPFRQIHGGVRARLYRQHDLPTPPPVMSKVPLVKWRAGQRFIVAQHALLNPVPLAPMQGALLHFKMFDDLPPKCEVEVERGEYYAGGREYRALSMFIRNAPSRSFFDARVSVRYENTNWLQGLGLITPFGSPLPAVPSASADVPETQPGK